MKKIISSFTFLTFLGSCGTALPLNSNFIYQANNNIRKKLDVPSIKQENDYLCGPASIQATFRYLNSNNTITQEEIYENCGKNIFEGGILLDEITADYVAETTHLPYTTINLPDEFGESSEDQILFQDFIYFNLNNNVPVIFGYYGTHSDTGREIGHAILINGIEINENDSSTTRYFAMNPYNGNESTFLANDLSQMLSGSGDVIGLDNGIDVESHTITLETRNETINKEELYSKKAVSVNEEINLTKETGIQSLEELKKYKTVTLNGFQIDYSWFDFKNNINQETWQTKYFDFKNHNWEKDNSKSWNYKYRNLARNQFETYYRSNLYQEDNGDLILSLQYKFQEIVELTTKYALLTIFLGTSLTLSF